MLSDGMAITQTFAPLFISFREHEKHIVRSGGGAKISFKQCSGHDMEEPAHSALCLASNASD